MKRREVEIFMAVKEIGDYVIQAMRNGIDLQLKLTQV